MNTPTKQTSPLIGRRRFLQATGATMMGAAFLAACGGSSGGSSSKITLQQWYHQYGEAGTLQAAKKYAADYSNASSKVNVNVNWIAGGYTAKLSPALLGSNPPDVFEYYVPDRNWVKQGLLEPLDDLFGDVKSDFNPMSLRSWTVDGKIYGVKMINDTQFLYYRKSLLSAAGIDPTTLTSYDALLEAANKLTTSKVKGLFLGNDSGTGHYENYIYAAGAQVVANNKVAFNTPAVVASFEKFREIATSNAILTGAPTDFTDPSAFIDGLCAIQWGGIWAMPAIIKALGDDFGIIPWPAFGAAGKPAVPSGGWAEMVSAKGKYVEESKALVKSLWITNTKVQEDWSLNYGFHIPPRKSVAASATKLQSGPAAEAVRFINQYGYADPPIINNAMFTALSDASSNIVKKNADVATELGKAAQICEAELQKILS